jgi:hypothetical protein
MQRRAERPCFPDPILLLAGLEFVYFPVRALFLCYLPEYAPPDLGAGIAIEAKMIAALKLVTIAACCTYWGTLIRLPLVRQRNIVRSWSGGIDRNAITVFLVLACVGPPLRMWAFVWDVEQQGGLSAITSLLVQVSLVALATVLVFARDRAQRIWLLPILAVNLASMYVFSFKEPFLDLIIYVLSGFSLKRSKIPWVKIVFGMALAAFVVFPLIEGRRTSDRLGLATVTEGIGNYFQAVPGGSGDNPLIRAVAHISQRLHGIESLCLYLQCVPDEIPFEGILPFGQRLVTSLVPRALFHDKPATSRGMYFNSVVVQRRSYSTNVTSIASFQIGDAYSIGGIPMVAIVAFWLGCYARYLSRLRTRFQTTAFFPYACIMLLPILQIEQDLVLVWTTLPKLLLVYLAAYKICGGVWRPSRSTTKRSTFRLIACPDLVSQKQSVGRSRSYIDSSGD